MTSSKSAGRILRLTIADTAALRACYMPFLRHKGLFIPSAQIRSLGEKLFLVLTFKQRNLTVAGLASVCWITPKGTGDGREAGFGLHFDEDAGELRAAIEGACDTDKDNLKLSLSYTL